MTGETVEQLKDRLRKEDEAKEEAFQKRLEQLRADTAKYRAEKEAEQRTKQQERERLLAGVRESREREMKESALPLARRRRHRGGVRAGVAAAQARDAQAPYPRGRDERTRGAQAERRQQPLDHPSRRECPGRELGRGPVIAPHLLPPHHLQLGGLIDSYFHPPKRNVIIPLTHVRGQRDG